MAKDINVNLDAMIPREDLALEPNVKGDAGSITSISLQHLNKSFSHLLSSLRKPDFQRETTHWSPEQVVSLIESFMDGDLIPSVILWKSASSYTFVIDGGHRLSALRAWIEDDYGDRTVSRVYLDHKVTKSQLVAAEKTRKLMNERVGSFLEWDKMSKEDPKALNLDDKSRNRLGRFATGAIPIQWIIGDVDKAESSFYKINQQGTPLDSTEELLIKNRKKAIPIAARAIIRAGAGNKYWSRFSDIKRALVEEKAGALYEVLFQPEYNTPIKTLDLPLGGLSGVRNALPLLIDLLSISKIRQDGKSDKIEDGTEDLTGDETCTALDQATKLMKRVSGNSDGSLGLHPAVYFYSSTGKFSQPMFMAVLTLFSRKILNNDDDFFIKFSKARESLEHILVNRKGLFLVISNQIRSQQRYKIISDLIDYLVQEISTGTIPDDSALIQKAGLKVSVLVPKVEAKSEGFTKDTKAAVLVKTSISAAVKCTICSGLLDLGKSVSFDHDQDLSQGGLNSEENCKLTHPYCNQSYKYHKKV